MNKDEIYSRLVQLLQDTFDLDPHTIHANSRLYDDLNLDSIDAVDLLVKLKPIIGSVQPDIFKQIRTVQDVVDALHALRLEKEVTAS